MKALFLLLLSTTVLASVDEISPRLVGEPLPLKTFQRVITHLEKTFQPFAESSDRELEFMTDEDSDWAQAFARRWETDQVIVYGGVRFIKGMTEDALTLILCHELGHLYGGVPYSDDHNRLSSEGQADYWATSKCIPQAIPGPIDSSRMLAAIKVITAFYASNRGLPAPQLSTPDHTVTDRMIFDHPTPQCRFDTYWAGFHSKNRPLCWFYPHKF